MFDAARAALASEAEPEATRTHNGLIAAFGLRLIKTGRLPKELGRMLNRAEEVRLLPTIRAARLSRRMPGSCCRRQEPSSARCATTLRGPLLLRMLDAPGYLKSSLPPTPVVVQYATLYSDDYAQRTSFHRWCVSGPKLPLDAPRHSS